MVSNVTSLTGNGLKDWLIQRVTSLFFAFYAVFLLAYLLAHPQLNYAGWHALFQGIGFKILGIIAVFSLTLHSWIGIWTVATDYIKCTSVRLSLLMAVLAWLLCQFIWALMILWGQ